MDDLPLDDGRRQWQALIEGTLFNPQDRTDNDILFGSGSNGNG